MKKIISFFLILFMLPVSYISLFAAESSVINIIDYDYLNKVYTLAKFSVKANDGSSSSVRYKIEGWNIKFNGYEFLYEVPHNQSPQVKDENGDWIVSFEIPLVDGTDKIADSIQKRIGRNYGENSGIYKAWMNLMRTGGMTYWDAYLQRYDNGNPTGRFAITKQQALDLVKDVGGWSTATQNYIETQYYNQPGPVKPQPVATVTPNFDIYHDDNKVTNNLDAPIKRTSNSIQVQLRDTSTVQNDTITQRVWNYWSNNNKWEQAPGTGVPGASDNLTIVNVDSSKLNINSEDSITFQLGTYTQSGLIKWVSHKVYSKDSSAKIIVHHKSTTGTTFEPNDIVPTEVDIPTKVYSRAIEGYIANKISHTVTVPSNDPDKTVEHTFIYDVNNEAGRIIVHHKDTDGNTVAASDPFLVSLNTPTEVFSKTVANHTPNKTSDMVTVPSSDPDKTVEYTFTYTKNPPATSPITGWIECNDTVIQGNDITIKGGGNDPQGGALTYSWEVDPSSWMVGTLNGTSSTVYFTQVGTVNVTLTVRSSSGGIATVTKAIRVLPAIPNAYIEIMNPIANANNARVNHKITLDANKSTSGSQRYTIDWSKTIWEIWVEDATPALTLSDIKTKAPFTLSTNSLGKQVIKIAGEHKQIDILSKKIGRVSSSLSITNTANYTGYANKQLDILPDLPPVADFTVTNRVLRDPNDSNFATGDIVDLTVMQDEDLVAKRVWLYSFDSDNDGSNKHITKNPDGSLKAAPTNETWYVYHNGSWQPVTTFGLDGSYASLKNLNIANVNSGNLTSLPLRVNHVGKYRVELIVQEDLLSYTIPEFITQADIQKSYTFDE